MRRASSPWHSRPATGFGQREHQSIPPSSRTMTAVDISGFIGAPALTQLVLHIDYRDNLVWCEYTPKK